MFVFCGDEPTDTHLSSVTLLIKALVPSLLLVMMFYGDVVQLRHMNTQQTRRFHSLVYVLEEQE